MLRSSPAIRVSQLDDPLHRKFTTQMVSAQKTSPVDIKITSLSSARHSGHKNLQTITEFDKKRLKMVTSVSPNVQYHSRTFLAEYPSLLERKDLPLLQFLEAFFVARKHARSETRNNLTSTGSSAMLIFEGQSTGMRKHRFSDAARLPSVLILLLLDDSALLPLTCRPPLLGWRITCRAGQSLSPSL